MTLKTVAPRLPMGWPVSCPRTEDLLHDQPAPLPNPRGPVSAALVTALSGEPADTRLGTALVWRGPVEQAPFDEDLQLALWLAYELSYRGLAGVSDRWEWHPGLVAVRGAWESLLEAGLTLAVGTPESLAEPDAAATIAQLNSIAVEESGPSLSRALMRDADRQQFAEFLIHRSIYHLKEADPHSWAIPRLSGSVKAALVTIQADEYGSGRTAAMHAQLFRTLMSDWQLDTRYGHYLDRVPGVTLLASNLISFLGLHRRLRGALVGHLAMFEMTSSVPNARYARAHRRLGGAESACRFFDEHVVADAAHEQIALHDLAGGLVTAEPQLSGDVIFGARCAQYADERFTTHLLGAWAGQLASLRAVGGR
ncbi:MAG TPA: iron-containing redox enzyme family protein [Propionibacteriaceae bacterium]|nr:iron-containing redox enzyme family protein [Propionibacteriaceae bacterium]